MATFPSAIISQQGRVSALEFTIFYVDKQTVAIVNKRLIKNVFEYERTRRRNII